MTGSGVGLLWPWPVACLSTNKDSLAFLAPHNSANVATLPEHLCLSHFLSWSLCKRSDDDSSELVILSLTVLPSWPGDAVIPMLPSGTLLLTILVLSYEASGFILSSVAVLACRSSFCSRPAFAHDAPFAKLLLAGAVRFYRIRPRIVRLDAAYWGLRLIAWIHSVLGAVAVIPWNPKRQKNRSCLPPSWTREELGKRSSIERFFGRVFLFFHLQRPPLCGWSEMASQVALTYAASIIVGLAAQQAGRPDLIRSPKRVLAHLWEDSEL